MKIVELIIDELEELMGFDAVALVNQPAIEAEFHAFASDDVDDAIAYQIIKGAVLEQLKERFVSKVPGESKDEYIGRCIPAVMSEGYDQEQASAICYSDWTDFNVDATTIPAFINEIGDKKKVEFESYSDYPKQAIENAKIALRWAEENGWGDCGTPVGKARANQLAKGEPISEETIARMAAFARHRENGQKDLGDGCGRLMWLAWGGDAGVDWASRKLKQIREGLSQEFSYFDDLSIEQQERLLEILSNIGYTVKEIEEDYELLDKPKAKFALPTKSSANPDLPTENSGQYKILYQYTGPKDSKNRSFCRRLLDLDLLFRKEDIQKLSLTGANSTEFGFYDIFQYKGSFGCRHNWNKKYVYRKKSIGLLEVAGLLLDAEENIEKPMQVKKFSFAVEGDQMRVVGPLMIPNKLIFRVDDQGEPYYVYFTEETIRQIAYKMMEEKKLNEVNLEHSQDDTVNGFLEETWIIEDPENDKQGIYNFDFPKGTWMGQYKIEDPAVWKMVKDGKLKGFSIEGYFADRLVQN